MTTNKLDNCSVTIVSPDTVMIESGAYCVRVHTLEGKLWFNAEDVALCISHPNVLRMCDTLQDRDIYFKDAPRVELDDWSSLHNGILYVSNTGLNRILAKSGLPECKPFRRWVKDSVTKVFVNLSVRRLLQMSK